ncbi:branched-chain amino acid ABC transporter substrate-binding protein [Anaerolineales bacterium HSG6]|nr:branched-chain amino acid ABC transporter substrate-binding protein [Anaerolineales bacterium HSG6]MDM8531568.1 branched-chain amino acid ABC transporter substrate-binding protein [Anaerolineales bacterium HSG25]
MSSCQTVPPTVKIGLIAPFEGTNRALGYEALFATKLAIQEQNTLGGINGYKIELIALNDFNEPEKAVQQAKALLADPDVLGVVGHFSTDSTISALPIYQQADMAVVIPWSIDRSTHHGDWSGTVTLAASESETLSQLKQIQQQLGVDSTVELTASVVLGTQLPSLSEGQAIQIQANAIQSGQIINQLAHINHVGPIFGGVESGSQQLIQVAGETANGFIFVSPGPSVTEMKSVGLDIEGFPKNYQALSGLPPTPRAALSYDATHVLLAAIGQVIQSKKTISRYSVSTHIGQITQNGVTGKISFDADGKRISAPIWVYQIEAGSYPGNDIKKRD